MNRMILLFLELLFTSASKGLVASICFHMHGFLSKFGHFRHSIFETLTFHVIIHFWITIRIHALARDSPPLVNNHMWLDFVAHLGHMRVDFYNQLAPCSKSEQK